MNFETEREICGRYFAGAKSDRLFFELTSKKKRIKAISRFSHDSLLYLNPEKIFKSNKMLFSKREILEFLAADNVYCICFNQAFDGKLADINRALEEMYSIGPYFLFNIDDKKGFLETEYNFSEHYSYMLA